MKKVFLILMTIIFGVFFGFIGSPMLIKYLNNAGFINWLLDNEWFLWFYAIVPSIFAGIYYSLSNKKRRGEDHE